MSSGIWKHIWIPATRMMKTLCDIRDTYNGNGKITVDQYQNAVLPSARIQDRIIQTSLPVLWRSAEAGNKNDNL